MSSPDNEYVTVSETKIVTFYANISELGLSDWYGHAWVGFGSGRDEERYGFYPEGLQNEGGRSADISYFFQVSSAAYENGLNVIEEYQNQNYVFGVRDCRKFVQSVARAIGLRVPSVGIKSPAEWMADLVDMN